MLAQQALCVKAEKKWLASVGKTVSKRLFIIIGRLDVKFGIRAGNVSVSRQRGQKIVYIYRYAVMRERLQVVRYKDVFSEDGTLLDMNLINRKFRVNINWAE
jgi:hypothetical protein